MILRKDQIFPFFLLFPYSMTTITSIHDDLFPGSNHTPDIQYDTASSKPTTNSSRRHSTLESVDSSKIAQVTSSWKMKALVLLCMLSLPGK